MREKLGRAGQDAICSRREASARAVENILTTCKGSSIRADVAICGRNADCWRACRRSRRRPGRVGHARAAATRRDGRVMSAAHDLVGKPGGSYRPRRSQGVLSDRNPLPGGGAELGPFAGSGAAIRCNNWVMATSSIACSRRSAHARMRRASRGSPAERRPRSRAIARHAVRATVKEDAIYHVVSGWRSPTASGRHARAARIGSVVGSMATVPRAEYRECDAAPTCVRRTTAGAAFCVGRQAMGAERVAAGERRASVPIR